MSKLPLRDRLVVLTRPEGRGAEWRSTLADAGAAVIELPLLEISFEPDEDILNDVLDTMGEYDWIVFTSANGVRGFFDRFFQRYSDIRSIGGVRFACVGPATEKALRSVLIPPPPAPLTYRMYRSVDRARILRCVDRCVRRSIGRGIKCIRGQARARRSTIESA